jgi:hypothetical protein
MMTVRLDVRTQRQWIAGTAFGQTGDDDADR